MSFPRLTICLLAVALGTPVARAADRPATAPAARYTVTATLAPALASADGRFRVEAEARVTPTVASPDGRFRVKSTAASCDPADDGLFVNGFEPL